MSIDEIIKWIEAHGNTVDLFKWLVLIFLAWIGGLFGYLRNFVRKPKIRISQVTSRCLAINPKVLGINNQRDGAIISAFLLEIEVCNCSNKPISIRDFSIQYSQIKKLPYWSPKFFAISLPNRVVHKTGSGTKKLKNWFSNFPDEMNDTLTVNGKIDDMDSKSAFVFFSSNTYGYYNPKIVDEFIEIKAHVTLVNGVKLTSFAKIKINNDLMFFEDLVSGVSEHIKDHTAWSYYKS